MRNQDIIDRDLAALWHPCTQMKDHEWLPLIPIKKAQGVWLEDFEGNQYLDAISSWWVNLFGHNNPTINAAIQQQMSQLSHILLAGFTHESIVTLSEKLVAITPEPLSRCFYADNGSSAVEVAIKMSYHYWQNSGKRNKKQFVTLSNSYHGETLGALAVGNVTLYKDTYSDLLMEVITVPSPEGFDRAEHESAKDYAIKMFEKMRVVLEERHAEIAAVIVEPLVQCAGYMRMYDPIYLRLLRELCSELDIHIIADEVAVGFGRTGTLFACEQADISPDFLCLSKGITGGYLPLSTVLTHEKIYEAFYADYSTLKAFLHSHSYTGNALACSAALATLEIFQQENVIEKNKKLASHMQQAIFHLEDHPHVAEVRQHGMIAAVELVQNKQDKTPYAWQERKGLQIYQYALQNNILLRPLGNVIYFMPPYVITPEQITQMVKVASEGIDRVTAQ